MITEQQRRDLDAEIDKFPKEFGLRSFPGKRFRVSRDDSYWSEILKGPVMCVEVRTTDDRWLTFASGSLEQLRELVTP